MPACTSGISGCSSTKLLVDRHNPLTTDQVLSLTDPVDLSQHNYTAFLNLLALPLIPWLGVVRTFNIVLLIANVLTALATYALARRVTMATRLEAWIVGVAFAWSPVLVARTTGHFSLVAAAPLAAFLLCLINADRSRSTRDAALAGLCMAWAGFCDVYYAVYCLIIAVGYLALATDPGDIRTEAGISRTWRWMLDVLILIVGGLVVGLLFGRGGRFELLGVPVSITGLYTPVLVLTVLVFVRVARGGATADLGDIIVVAARRCGAVVVGAGRVCRAALAGPLRSRRATRRRTVRHRRRPSGAAARAASICWRLASSIPIIHCPAGSTMRHGHAQPMIWPNTRPRSASLR